MKNVLVFVNSGIYKKYYIFKSLGEQNNNRLYLFFILNLCGKNK